MIAVIDAQLAWCRRPSARRCSSNVVRVVDRPGRKPAKAVVEQRSASRSGEVFWSMHAL
jgi:hypothetical protein